MVLLFMSALCIYDVFIVVIILKMYVLSDLFTHLIKEVIWILGIILELLFIMQIERDAGRLVDCRARMNFCPLGACALAGTGLPIDRFMTSEALGFTAPLRNRYFTSFYFM